MPRMHLYFPRLATFLFLVVLGVCFFALALTLGEISAKWAIAAIIVMMIFYGAFASHHPKAVFLFAWLFTLTYNRQYFSFESIVGYHAGQGPYWIVSDIFLLSLIGIWIFEVVVQKKRQYPLGNPLWQWYLPFVVVCLLSVFVAERVEWTLFEMLRVLKVALILFYSRYNLDKREWWVGIGAIGLALFVQSALGIVEVTLNKHGISWLFGLGSSDLVVSEKFSPEAFYGRVRATATMNHPPDLACYLLLTTPVFWALGLTAPGKLFRSLSIIIGAVGIVGLAVTFSRFPWLLAAVQLLVLIIGLALIRLLPLKRVIGIASVVLLVATLSLAVLHNKIADRMTGDFDASVEQRLNGLRASLNMLYDKNMFLGIGLNNYAAYVAQYHPDMDWDAKESGITELATKYLHVRFIAAPENGFMFVLVETGIIGLGAFILYLFGVFATAKKSISSTDGYYKAASLGLAVGFLGALGHQAVDCKYWIDPVLYTFTIMVGLLNNSPALFPREKILQPKASSFSRINIYTSAG